MGGWSFPGKRDYRLYYCATAGGIIAAGVLYLIASGKAGFDAAPAALLKCNEHSPGQYSMTSAIIRKLF
jgi:aquaporin Z